MNRMFSLIANENMKIYRQMSTYIMLGLLVAVVIAAGFIIKNNGQSSSVTGTDWKAQLTQRNQSLQKELAQPRSNLGAVRDEITKEIALNSYRIQHNLPPIEGRTLWGFVIQISGLVSIISLFTIIVSAGIVAGEFTSGTIKLLLIRPLKRWKLLLSKYISVLIFALSTLILFFIISFLIGGAFYSFNGVNQPYLTYTNGTVNEVNMVGYIFQTYGYDCVNLLMMATFAFMISAVFRNNSLAVGISLFLLYSGDALVSLLSSYSWVKYVLFANTDLTRYVNGTPVVKDMTLTFSITVLAIYFIVFNAISWIVFSERDVAA